MAEKHDIHGRFRGQSLDFWESGDGSNVEAGLLEDQAAGVNELVVPPKDEHRGGSRHGGQPAY